MLSIPILRRAALVAVVAAACLIAWPAARAGGEPRTAGGGPLGHWLQAAGLASRQVGAIALPLDGGPALLAHEATRPLNPASTIKLITTYAGLALLGPDFRWRTEARLRGPLQAGVLRGDLVLRGGGDPKMVIEDLTEFVARMRASGLEQIDGDLVVDDAIFDTGARSVDDFDGDPSQPYNVRPFGALMNFKAARIVVTPNGKGAALAFDPALADVGIDNRVRLVEGPCRFGAGGLQVRDGGRGDAPVVRVVGNYSRACGEQGVFAALLDHRQFVHALFKAAWQAAGGRWSGQAQTQHASAAEVVQLMRDAVAGVAREPAPAAELAARQAALVGRFARALQTTAGLAGLVAAEVSRGRDPADLSHRVDAIRAVTPTQVRDYAARWWKPDTLRVLVAGDWAAAGASVKTLGATADMLRLPKATLDLDRATLRAP